jgi:ATP-dependent DNA ligase
MFKAFEFCLPTNATKVPAAPEWLHEIKHDGFRIRVERDGDRVRLIAAAMTGRSDIPGSPSQP